MAVTVTAREKAEFLPTESPGELGPGDVRGGTVATLVSPGTELAWNYLGGEVGPERAFPNVPGYAAVFRAEEIGPEVRGIRPGALVFAMGGHRSVQQHAAADVVPVPAGLSAEQAVVARLAGVTMTTLVTTAARPGDVVLVTGAGPVGYLAAHLFANSGYEVHVVEPNPARREMVRRPGIRAVYDAMSAAGGELKGKVALVLECSGHEQAALDGAQLVRRRGEVVLVGVPWRRRSDLSAHELLSAVFHRYAILRSGWEWELPLHTTEFSPHSIFGGYRLALRWLAEGRIPLAGLVSLHDPADAQAVYQGLLHGTAEGLFHVFDWANCNREND